MSEAHESTSTPPAHKNKGLAVAKKIILAMVLLNVAAFAPAIVLGILGWHDAVFVAMLAGLAAFFACGMGSGWVTGLRISVPFAVFVTLTVWAAPYAIAAGLVLGAAAFWRGFGARLGLHNALMMTVITLGFLVADPPKFENSFSPPIVAGLVALGATLYVTLIMFFARGVIKPPPLTRLVTARVVAYSVVLFLMIGITTYFVVRLDLGQGGSWIILTILVVFQPYLGIGFKKAGQRVLGTLGGFVIALILGEFISSGPWLYIVGVALFTLAGTLLMLGKPYGVFVLFLTPAVVLVTSAGSTVDQTAVIRLEATGAGVAIVLLVMLVLTPFAKHLQAKANAPRF